MSIMTFTSVISAASGSEEAPATPTDILFAYRSNNTTARTSTTTLQDDNQLRFDVEANKWYAYQAWLRSDVASTTSPPNLQLAVRKPVGSPPATTDGACTYHSLGESTAMSASNWAGQVGGGGWNTTWTIGGSNIVGNADETAIQGSGMFHTTQPGEFVLRWAPSISTTNSIRLLSGSWIMMTPME